MKKIIALCLFLLFITGCSKEKVNMNDFFVGVIETTTVKEKSKILYFNSNLELINSLKYNYAELSSSFEVPGYSNDGIYFVPRGLEQKADTKKIISLQIDSQSFTEYDVDRVNIQYSAVNSDYIYSTSNLNGISYITQTNKLSGKVKELEFNRKYISSLNMYGDKLIAFINDLDHKPYPKSEIVIFNKELEIEKRIDLSDYGMNHFKSLIDEDILYVPNPTTIKDEVDDKLLIINLKNNEIYQISLLADSPNDIFSYKEDLIVTHSSLIDPDGTKISKISKKNGKFNSYDLKETIYLSAIKDNYLLIVTKDNKLIKYDINQDFKKIKEIDIKNHSNLYISNIYISNI